MTQVGKCDICRQRKIKCDEVHPICGGCKKKNRPCHYSYGTVSKFIDDGRLMMDGCRPVTIKRLRVGERPHKIRVNSKAEGDAIETKPEPLLRLRSSRQTKDGIGLFQTFAPFCKKTDSDGGSNTSSSSQSDADEISQILETWDLIDPLVLLREPSNETLSQVGRWMNITQSFAENYGMRCVLGEWMELVPSRLGNSQSIDAAVECFHSSIVALSNRTQKNFAATDGSNAKALRSIRSDILSGDRDVISNDVLMAICLLTFVEVFVRAGTGEYKYHQTGLMNLLVNLSNNGAECSEATRHILDSCVTWEFMPAILQNRDSIFDSPVWMNIERPNSFTREFLEADPEFSNLYNSAIDMVRRYWAQLPRLVRLVKAAALSPDDAGLREEASELALQMYSTQLEDFVHRYFELGTISVVPTTASLCVPYIEHSLSFASYPLHAGFVNYWTIRTFICGLVLHLMDLFPVMPSAYMFDFDEVAAHDLQCAKYLLMSVQFSRSPRTALPIDDIRQITPMQAAYSAYDRLESRAGGPESSNLESQHARRMKEACVVLLTTIEESCGLQGFMTKHMDWKHRLITGRSIGTRLRFG